MQSDGIFQVISCELDFVPDDQLYGSVAISTVEEDCALSNIFPGDFQQKWPLHVTKIFGQEFKWLIIKTKQTISDIPLNFHHINKDTTITFLSVSSKLSMKPIQNLPSFSYSSPKSGSLNIWNLWAQNQNLHHFVIIWPPNVPKIYILKVISHLHTDMVKSSSLKCRQNDMLMICCWHRLYCSPFEAEKCSKTLEWLKFWTLQFCCLYFAFAGKQCLYSAYSRQCLYSGWFPNLPFVTQSCVFSQSRQIHPGQLASHVMLPSSRVTCHVKTVTPISSDSYICGMLPAVCHTLSCVVLITGMQCVQREVKTMK